MPRKERNSFCCGAGGARMFMEETIGTRINIARTEEALATGAKTIATACPFCMTMMSDGVKSCGKDESVQVKDIAEIVAASLK
jgi:Fe-S oxidoreductase